MDSRVKKRSHDICDDARVTAHPEFVAFVMFCHPSTHGSVLNVAHDQSPRRKYADRI